MRVNNSMRLRLGQFGKSLETRVCARGYAQQRFSLDYAKVNVADGR